MSEQGNVSIVSGDDVKGTLTLKMKDVPWEQALDTILDLKGLTQKREGNVITAMTLEKMKKDEVDRQAAMEAKRKSEFDRAQPAPEPLITRVVSIDYNDAKKLTENIRDLLTKDKDGKTLGSVKVDEHSNSLIIQATRQEMTRLFPHHRENRQTDLTDPDQGQYRGNHERHRPQPRHPVGRRIWTKGWESEFIHHSRRHRRFYRSPGLGSFRGVHPNLGFDGDRRPGIRGQFPGGHDRDGLGVVGAAFGTIGGNILDVQLSALQKDGKLNILSSPSLTTLDNQMAFTENGDKFRLLTTETSGGTLTRSIKEEEATLRLEITPHVIDGEKYKNEDRGEKKRSGPPAAMWTAIPTSSKSRRKPT